MWKDFRTFNPITWYSLLREEVSLEELPPKGLLKVEVTAADGGAGPDREDSVPKSGFKIHEDTVRVEGSVSVQFLQQVGVDCRL